MLGIFSMSVIVSDNLIEKILKCMIRIVWSCIYSDSWICVLTARENCSFKAKSMFVNFVVKFLIDIFSQVFTQQWFCSCWEDWETM